MRTKAFVQIAICIVGCAAPAQVLGAVYVSGDIFAGVASGLVQQWRETAPNTFTLVDTLDTTNGGFTTGMAFDASGNLYVTNFSASRLAKFDNAGALINANYASGLSTPESVVFDTSGNFYVGNLGNGIRKYDSTGAFQGSVNTSRVDWFDLSADQSTFVWGDEGSAIHTVSNATPGTAGADFAGGLTQAFAMRILPGGGLLVADLNEHQTV